MSSLKIEALFSANVLAYGVSVNLPYTNRDELDTSANLDPQIGRIRGDLIELCALAEGELERFWSQRILDSLSSKDAIQSIFETFPYCKCVLTLHKCYLIIKLLIDENYTNLVRLEASLLSGTNASFRHVLFVGSGSLPLTSILLARDHIRPAIGLPSATHGGVSTASTWAVTNVDMEQSANELGWRVSCAALQCEMKTSGIPLSSEILTQPEGFSFLTCKAESLSPRLIACMEVIYLAALVGLHPIIKSKIALHIISHMRAGTHLVMRSANSLRRLIYPAVNEEEIIKLAAKKGIHVELVVTCHPGTSASKLVITSLRQHFMLTCK